MELPAIIHEKARDLKGKALEDYVTLVYSWLEAMKPGDRLYVNKITKTVTRDLFIETVKFYMREHEWQGGISFSKCFSEVRKEDLAFIRQKTKV